VPQLNWRSIATHAIPIAAFAVAVAVLVELTSRPRTAPVARDAAVTSEHASTPWWEEAAGLLRPTRPATPGMWTSRAELLALPTSGAAWRRVKAAADGPFGPATVAHFTADHDVHTLATALVYARTGRRTYRTKAADAIMRVLGTEEDGEAVMFARNIVCYIIAADLIDLRRHDPAREAAFRRWLAQAPSRPFKDRSLIDNDRLRTNNHGRVAGAALAAIAIYLEDHDALARTARIFKGFLGDEAYDGFRYRYGTSWQGDPRRPLGINAASARRGGHDVDGALPEEMRRGCELRWPPCRTGYAWEGLGGVVVEARLLERAGYDVWNWQDRAILRAAHFLERLDREFGGWWAEENDTWQPWLINDAYGTSFPTAPANSGKNMGYTDWLYGAVAG
jgi:hypothetical protein